METVPWLSTVPFMVCVTPLNPLDEEMVPVFTSVPVVTVRVAVAFVKPPANSIVPAFVKPLATVSPADVAELNTSVAAGSVTCICSTLAFVPSVTVSAMPIVTVSDTSGIWFRLQFPAELHSPSLAPPVQLMLC